MTRLLRGGLLFARRQYGTNEFDGHANATNTAKRTTMRDFFYKPDGAWAADFIPFYANGRFRLFYLLDWRNHAEHGEGTPWYQISTTDFVRFEEHGEMLPRGSREEQDLYVFTGSAIEAEGRTHIFYTGHNPHFRRVGKPEQGVMHAVSDDLLQWIKLPEETFFAPSDGYEPHDWRDPYVWFNEDAGEYWMLPRLDGRRDPRVDADARLSAPRKTFGRGKSASRSGTRVSTTRMNVPTCSVSATGGISSTRPSRNGASRTTV